MVVRKNDDRIQSLADLSGKIIGANSLFSLGGGQSQWLTMMENGVSFFVAPKQASSGLMCKDLSALTMRAQIIFTFSEVDAIEYLQSGFVVSGFG